MAKTHFVAKAIVLDSKNNFLLLTRSETHPSLAGFYDLPGGMVEPNEEPGDAVRREIAEETGLIVTTCEVLYATTMMIGAASYPTLLYLCSVASISPEIRLSWEHSDYEWAGMSKLGDVEPQLAPTYQQALAYISSNNILQDI